ncbi:MAG: SBBP repeat-containing protein, partial [Bacteroidales bacterium]|nr:SBBP repeat-containing protein [Bacteroidales bacterium]
MNKISHFLPTGQAGVQNDSIIINFIDFLINTNYQINKLQMEIKRLFSTAILCIFIINVNAQLSFQQNNLQEAEKAKITAKVNKTKIPWIKNIGQQQPEVAFYAETFSGTVFVTNTGKIVYSLPVDSTKSYILRESFIITSDVLKKSDIYGELKSQTKVNYFTGNNSDNWQTNVPTFQTVNLGEVWKGIEVKLNAYGNNIEKLFYINPGVAPENIQLKFQGAKKLMISQTGELIIKTPEGNIKFTKPVAYQIINNKKEYVEVAYTTKGKTYGFETGKYNPDYELVIDPLMASTFVGGTNTDRIYSIVLDGSDNVYITGSTYSSDYPVTASSYDPTYNGKYEVVVSKFTPDLSELTASTFMGGGEYDVGLAMTLDGSGNVYVTGYAHSGFPTTASAYSISNNGMEDVFISKLSSDLSTLQASTFIGGLATEYGYSIAIDGSGNVLVTGCTYSADYPTAGTPYNEDPGGGADIYISKFNSDLSTLTASTYIGSSNDDYAYSIVLDDSDNVFITGFSFADDYPTAGTPYDNTYNGCYDAVISKLTSNLSTLTASTYLGGSSDEWGHSVIFDASGDLLITGFTYSSDFPTAGTPYDDSQNGGADVFVTKINSDLSTLSASTFIGGSLSEEGHCIAIDGSGNIFISGHTKSSDYPTAGSPYDDSHNGS